MTVVNPKSISGINSITTGSGSDNLLTIHTSDANSTERVRINSSGDVIVGSGITLSQDGDIFTTGITTFTNDVKINVDSKKIILGAGADLEVFHNGTNSHMRTQTGNLIIDNNSGGTVNIRPKVGEEGVVCTTDGSTALYHDGTKKFETSSSGVTVTGGLTATTGTFTGDVDIADKIVHTGDTNTAIRFPEADTITFEANGFEQVRIDNDVQMFVEGNSKTAKLQLHREDVSIDAGDVVGQIAFTGRDQGGAGIQRVGAAISAVASNNWDTGQTTGYSATHLDFYTQAQQSAYSTLTPRVRISSAGKVNIGDTQMSSNLLNVEDGTAAAIDIASHGSGGDTAYIGVKKSAGGGLTFGISNRDIIFKTGASYSSGTTFDSGNEKLRLLSAGGLTFNGDTAAANALDDYEEGSWTPSSNATLTSAAGRYTKIGRQVTIHCRVVVDTNSSSNQMNITGLPYTPDMNSSLSNGSTPSGFGYISGSVITGGIQIHTNYTTNQLHFYTFTSALTQNTFSGRELRFGVVYYVGD